MIGSPGGQNITKDLPPREVRPTFRWALALSLLAHGGIISATSLGGPAFHPDARLTIYLVEQSGPVGEPASVPGAPDMAQTATTRPRESGNRQSQPVDQWHPASTIDGVRLVTTMDSLKVRTLPPMEPRYDAGPPRPAPLPPGLPGPQATAPVAPPVPAAAPTPPSSPASRGSAAPALQQPTGQMTAPPVNVAAPATQLHRSYPLVVAMAAPKTTSIPFPPQGLPPGDIRLELTTAEPLPGGARIVVQFRPSPKSRHNRPLSRQEWQQTMPLVPRMVRPAESRLIAVIETADEGFYDIRLEGVGNAGVELTCTLFENSARSRVKVFGKGKPAANGSIARLMMPEGIFWDDDSYFQGNIESSQSITRFNSATGVVWREYH